MRRVVTVGMRNEDTKRFVERQFVVESLHEDDIGALEVLIENNGWKLEWVTDEFGRFVSGWN